MFIKNLAQTIPLIPKALLTSSLTCIIMLGGLSGCQSTGGISNPSVNQPNSTRNIPVENTESSTPVLSDPKPYDDTAYPPEEDAKGNNEDEALYEDSSVHKDSSIDTSTIQPTGEKTVILLEPKPEPKPELESDSNANEVNKKEANVFKRSPPVDPRTTQQILLEQARHNSQLPSTSSSAIQDGENIPAFKKLMDTGVKQLRNGQISAAQSTFTRAQRLAPQSSAVYFYLGQVALKQNQPLKAEAMARRGLVVAQLNSRKRALWQVILKAGQAQGNARVIKEASNALGN